MNLHEKYNNYVKRHKKRHMYNSGSMYMRDSDMTKTYKAEWIFTQKNDLNNPMSKEDAEKYFNKVLSSKFWKDRSGKYVHLTWGKDMGDRTMRAAVSYGSVVKLTPSFSTKYVILHELCHSLGFMNHGLYFRINLVKMVSRFLGRDLAKDLKESFRKQGLKMNKPRPPLSYEKWLERYEKSSLLG